MRAPCAPPSSSLLDPYKTSGADSQATELLLRPHLLHPTPLLLLLCCLPLLLRLLAHATRSQVFYLSLLPYLLERCYPRIVCRVGFGSIFGGRQSLKIRSLGAGLLLGLLVVALMLEHQRLGVFYRGTGGLLVSL